MTNAPGGQGQHPGTDSFFDSLRRIDLRRGSGRWVGGVCSGIAERIGLDPLVIRVGFIVATAFFGFGLALYLWAWLLIPDRDERTHLEQGLRDGRGESILLLVAAVLVTIGVFPWWGGPGGFWNAGWWVASLAITVGVVVGVVYLLRSSFEGRPTGQQGTTQQVSPQPSTSPQGTAQQVSPQPSASPQGTPQHATPRPPKPPRPVRERRKTGGPLVALIATGLAMLAFGGLLWSGTEFDLPGNDLVVALAAALAVLGLVVLFLGAAGRHSGWPGFLATVLLITTVVVAPLPDDYGVSTRVGQDTWRPTNLEEGSTFALGAGEGILDLRRLDPADLDGQTISADVNIGHLRILVPDDLTIRVEAGSGIGTVNLNNFDPSADDGAAIFGGLNVTEDLVLGDGPVDLVIDAQVGIGQVSVERN